MLIDSGLPEELWSEAIHCAAYILNRMVGKNNMTPFQLWFKKKPNVHRIRTFRSVTFMLLPKVQRKKWDERSRKLILVEYDQESQNYRLWDMESRCIEIARDVVVRDGVMFTDVRKPNTYNFYLPCETDTKEDADTLPDNQEFNGLVEPTSDNEDSFYDCMLMSPPNTGIPLSKRHTCSTDQKDEHFALDQRGRIMRVKYD